VIQLLLCSAFAQDPPAEVPPAEAPPADPAPEAAPEPEPTPEPAPEPEPLVEAGESILFAVGPDEGHNNGGEPHRFELSAEVATLQNQDDFYDWFSEGDGMPSFGFCAG
jgi:hypothetical protein